jgi:hypothetical protein
LKTVAATGTWTATLDLVGSSKALTAKGSFSLDPTKEAVYLTIPFPAAMTIHVNLDPYSALISGITRRAVFAASAWPAAANCHLAINCLLLPSTKARRMA